MTKAEREIVLQEKQWEKEKSLQERKYKIKKEKRELKSLYGFKLPTSKLLILFLFINCTLIELFTGWVTIKSIDLATLTMVGPDFTPLVTLIGAVVSEVIGFAIYAIKSAKENTEGGIIYETTMAKLQQKDEEQLGSFFASKIF